MKYTVGLPVKLVKFLVSKVAPSHKDAFARPQLIGIHIRDGKLEATNGIVAARVNLDLPMWANKVLIPSEVILEAIKTPIDDKIDLVWYSDDDTFRFGDISFQTSDTLVFPDTNRIFSYKSNGLPKLRKPEGSNIFQLNMEYLSLWGGLQKAAGFQSQTLRFPDGYIPNSSQPLHLVRDHLEFVLMPMN